MIEEKEWWKIVKKTRKFHFCEACGAVILIGNSAFVHYIKFGNRFPDVSYFHYSPHIPLRFLRRFSLNDIRVFICQFTPEWHIPVEEYESF